MRLLSPSRVVPASRIDRYILRQLALALVAVTGGLVALIWLTQSLRFVELVVNRGLSFRVFVQLTSLLIPNFVAVILPITTFVVIQFIYQRLAGDRELTVMRAAGLSPAGLARPALVLALLAMAAAYALNLWIVPASFGAFREFQFEIRNRVAAFLLQEGVFTPVSDDLTVYVRVRERDGTLRGILVDDARNKNSHATILAESGRLIADSGTPRVLLVNGSRQELDHQTGRLNVLTFAENTVDLTQGDKPGEQRFRDPTEMSISELLHPAPGSVFERDIGKLRVEAHRRLSSPLTCLSFTMIALVSVLMGTFRRHGGLLRPFLAIMTVVALVALGLAVANLAAREPALIPLIWVHAVAPTLVCVWVLFGPQLHLMPAGLQARLGVT
ncbi:LPS export ABC transporter permease LptF [Limobrevibacterium gyesilva]|uniref:LPS export ABC transporter permease LptF n=1 Tax=Limobrevibacterium gyesilva TaxID=2991712 RepID=A0AA42CD27_9PROT|nr:LPS export ABC transporter permease LptF [Limobrevibacterium gyesilva]MCW3473149.1 LPS export ABC transporter permease LptF [Limobrevibacterium gyesilva]